MKDIINRNYISIINRGMINKNTSKLDFVLKLEEEVQEFIDAFFKNEGNEKEELADIILVCLNIAKHYDIDIEFELNRKIAINEKR